MYVLMYASQHQSLTRCVSCGRSISWEAYSKVNIEAKEKCHIEDEEDM